MIGLVLVTHGHLATEFVTAMEHVVGPQTAIEAICIGPEDDMEARRADIAAAIAKVDSGNGVIVLTGANNSRAYVTQGDVAQANGMVHIVNGVLIPPA